MRNILRISKESAATQFKPMRLSREEAEIINNVAESNFEEADDQLTDARRLVEVTDAMEDLAAVADGIDEMTPNEAALIRSSARMAVAGTDVESEEIVPALESLGRPGLEMADALRERAKAIWESVLKTAGEAWEKIVTWLSNVFSRAEFIRSSAEEVRGYLKETEEQQKAPLLISEGFTKYYMTATKVMSNAAEMKKQMEVELATAKWVFDVYSKKLLEIGNKLAKAYEKFDIQNVDSFINEIKAAVTKDMKFPGRKPGEQNRFPNADCFVGDELLGGVSLVERVGKAKEGTGVLGELDALYNTEITLDSTHIKKITPTKAIEFAMPSFKECEELLKLSEEIADHIEKFSRGAIPKELAAVRKEIDAAIAKNPDAIAKAYGKSDMSEEQQAMLKAAASMTVAFANWTKDPLRGVISCIEDVAFSAIWIASLVDERFNPKRGEEEMEP